MNMAMATDSDKHLTHDESLELEGLTCRIRIWMGAELTPILLVTDRTSDMHYQTGTSKIANYVNNAILGHPIFGMLYFEGEKGSQPFQAHFNHFGNIHRLKFFNPMFVAYSWQCLERIIGGPIER